MFKILIVDDEKVARDTLADFFHLEGYEVKAVDSGETAVKKLSEEPFDAMVLDLKMPGMSGMEVLNAIVDRLPELTVIVLTAYGTMDSAIQAIRYQVHDYLLKPVSPGQVLESVQNALEKSQKGSQKVERLPGGAVLAWDKRQITWAHGELSLTPTEARLLKVLFERRNEMVSHTELVYLIQGYRIATEDAAKILRPVVSRLRQKLSAVPEWDDRIKNVRGAGYVLED